MHYREITHIVKTDKNSIGCKDQMFFLLPFEIKIKLKLKKSSPYETTMQKLDLRL